MWAGGMGGTHGDAADRVVFVWACPPPPPPRPRCACMQRRWPGRVVVGGQAGSTPPTHRPSSSPDGGRRPQQDHPGRRLQIPWPVVAWGVVGGRLGGRRLRAVALWRRGAAGKNRHTGHPQPTSPASLASTRPPKGLGCPLGLRGVLVGRAAVNTKGKAAAGSGLRDRTGLGSAKVRPRRTRGGSKGRGHPPGL